MKKLISSILSAAMLLSSVSFTIASAEESITEDFSNYTAADDVTLPEDFYWINDCGEQTVNSAAGVFGKEADDTSMRIHQWKNSSSDSNKRLQARWKKNIEVNGAEYIHYSTEVAVLYSTSIVRLGVQLLNEEGNKDFSFAEMSVVSSVDDRALNLSVTGSDKIIAVPDSKWLKFDFVYEVSSGLADIYYNGELVSDDYDTGITGVTGFNEGEFFITRQWCSESPNWFKSTTYLDNLSCSMLNEYPGIDSFESYGDEYFTDYTGGFNDNIYLNIADDADTTAHAVAGVFGKDADDTSFMTRAARHIDGDSECTSRWQQVRWNNNMPVYPDNKSKHWKISFAMAYTGSSMNRWVTAEFTMGNGDSQTAVPANLGHAIEITGTDDGFTMTAGGGTIEVDSSKYSENQWMKFDIVVDSTTLGSATYDVYLDGEKINDAPISITMPSDNKSWYTMSKITKLIFATNHHSSAADGWYKSEADTYVDDISIEHYEEYPVIGSSTEVEPVPTEAVTDAPIDTPTEAPTDTPTEAPTEAPADGVITFNDYVSDDNATLPNGFVDQSYTVNTTDDTSRRVALKATGGVYGKAEDDIAYTISHQWLAAAKKPSTQWYQTRYNANLTDGKYIHFGTDMAYERTSAERKLAVGVTTADGNKDINEIVKISCPSVDSAQQIMTFFGSETVNIPRYNGWMRFDAVIECETGLADVYYNGELVVEDYATGVTGITGFRQGTFCVYQTALANGSFGKSTTYLDNVICRMPDEEPVITGFTPYEDLDFAGYEGGFTENFKLNITTDTATKGVAVSGMFGKDTDDTSFLASVPFSPNGTDSPAKWQQVRFINQSTRMSENYPMFYKLSFEMAYTGQNMNRWVAFGSTAWADDDEANRIENDHSVLEIKDDILSVNGVGIDTDEGVIAEETWMKFDIIVKSGYGSGTYDVYLNGKKIAEDVAMTFKNAIASWQTIEKIHMAAFAINHESSQADGWTWPECDTYFDNVSISAHGSYPYIKAADTEAESEFVECTYYTDGTETDNIFKADSVKAVINEELDAAPVIAVYGNDGVLRSTVVGEKGDKEITAEFDAGDKVKLMVWDSAEAMKPVHTAIDLTQTTSLAAPTAAEFEVSGMFTDGAVLQRDKEVNVWGTTDSADGTTINVVYGENSAQAVVADGKWTAELEPMAASTEGKTLYVYSADGFEEFNDILVGDVYFVAGQSNAELPMSKTEHYSVDRELATESDNIRFFYQARSDAFEVSAENLVIPQENPVNPNYKWEYSKPTSIGKLSAIGYYFADKISEITDTEIPVGIIQTAFGGAALHELSPKAVNDMYGFEVAADRAKYNAYNTLVAPTEKYSARGMLWYQGESDSSYDDRATTYVERFDSMVEYIRGIQGDDFPVFFVQLSSHTDYTDNGSQGWTFQWKVPRFRNIQNECEDVTEDVYMVPSLDLGLKEGDISDTAHPIYKKEVGHRLADVAIERIYKENGDTDSVLAAKVKEITYDATGATVVFERVNGGLATVDGGTAVLGFELIKDGTATAAAAEIVDEVTVRVTGVDNPTGVRYAYYNAASPAIANLKSGNGLPCPTFSENGFEIEPLTLGQER